MALGSPQDRMVKRNRTTLELTKTEAELLSQALSLLPKEKHSIVYDKICANVQNIITLHQNAERAEILRRQQMAMADAAKQALKPPTAPSPKINPHDRQGHLPPEQRPPPPPPPKKT